MPEILTVIVDMVWVEMVMMMVMVIRRHEVMLHVSAWRETEVVRLVIMMIGVSRDSHAIHSLSFKLIIIIGVDTSDRTTHADF